MEPGNNLMVREKVDETYQLFNEMHWLISIIYCWCTCDARQHSIQTVLNNVEIVMIQLSFGLWRFIGLDAKLQIQQQNVFQILLDKCNYLIGAVQTEIVPK